MQSDVHTQITVKDLKRTMREEFLCACVCNIIYDRHEIPVELL